MTGILLVHGAWHGPWCWNGFVDRLTESGHDVRAVQLRGHDQPPGRIWYRVRHYVEDVQRMVAAFPAPPFLIGHSMGGLVVQKYLESGYSPGAVLMASVPPRGTMQRSPGWPSDTDRISEDQPAPAPQAVHWHIQAGTRVVLHPRYPARDRQPLLHVPSGRVLPGLYRPDDGSATITPGACASARSGGRMGLAFHPAEVHSTARAYQTEAEIFPGMGHDMMLDTDWRKVADRIGAWILDTKQQKRQILAP